MPSHLTLHLVPTYPWKPDVRQAHGLACRLFEGPRTEHTSQTKQFTLRPPGPNPDDPAAIVFHFTWLGDASPPLNLATLQTVRLGHVTFHVRDATLTTESYAELLTPSTATQATLTFRSPTYFSRDGRAELLPDPRLMLKGYARRWNASLPNDSPLHLPDDLVDDLARAAYLADYDLTTLHMDSGYGKPRPGFVGTATLNLPTNTPPPTRTAFTTLTRYATYSGTGAQTTHGYGATTTELTQPRHENPTVARRA
ncbi:CRISPR system precrRNA processing endoribonuclease RAMP protein Cas6 [Actinocorallia lasiicapitis]